MKYCTGSASFRLGLALAGLVLFFPRLSAAAWEPGSCVWTSPGCAAWEATANWPSLAAAESTAISVCSAEEGGACTIHTAMTLGVGSCAVGPLEQRGRLTLWRPGGLTAQFNFCWPADAVDADCPVEGQVIGVDGEGEPACVDPAPECDGSVTGQDFWRPVFSASDTGDICHESSHCKLSAVNVQDLNGSDNALVRFLGTADDCASEPEVPITAANQATQCIAAGGDTWCTTPDLADENCGYFNEEFLCLDAVPEGNCVFYGNGDMACGSTATSPPAPDDGVTPGDKATPDSTITNNTNDIDIFNNTTVAGSSGATSGSGGGPGGSSGDGPPEALEIELDLSPIIEDEPDSGGFDDSIETATEGLEGELDGILDELSDPADFAGETSVNDDISTAMGILPCADLDVSVPGQTMTLTCADAAPIRDWLRWVCGVLFLLGMFNLVTQRPVAR